jgi:chromosome partitioning protein
MNEVNERCRERDWVTSDANTLGAFCLRSSPAFDKLALSFFGLEPLGRVIAIANQKGGVGKTTTAINLGAALASRDMWTLIIDCDPQANTTGGLGFAKDPSRRTLYHALMLDVPLKELVQKSALEGLHLIPSDKNLVGATIELVDRPEREKTLRKRMEKFRDEFNFILLDCPPALDLLTLNALVAADSVIVPVQCEYFALEGVSELLDTLIRIRRSHNHNLAVEGILLTMFDERTNLSHQVRDDLRDFFGDQVFSTVIPRNVRLAEAPSFGQPIFLYDPNCRGAGSYLELAQEVINHDQKGPGSRAERPAPDC